MAGSVVVLLLAFSGRYGFHRDELYFVVAGRDLDWGFVDQPPFAPFVARISELALGTSTFALRLLPAITIGIVAVLAAVMTRRMGGGRPAQVFAAFAASWSGFSLAVGHLLSTATFELLFWGLAAAIAVHLLAGGDQRWWLGLGAVFGVGLLNKHLIGALAVAILIGIVATPERRLLRSWWPWGGVAIAAVIAAPNLAWQAANGWPQLEMGVNRQGSGSFHSD